MRHCLRPLACVLAFFVLGLAGCSKTGPSSISVTGSWKGTFCCRFSTPDTMSATLNQAGTSVTGSFTLVNGTSENGTITGTMTGSNFAGTMIITTCSNSTSNSTVSVNGTVTGSSMTWNSGGVVGGAIHCRNSLPVTIHLTKQ